MSQFIRTEVLKAGPFNIGKIILDRPKALNALDLGMFNAITSTLREWEGQPDVVAVIIESSQPKAFCAGGDVKAVVTNLKDEGIESAKDYFSSEYFTDYFVRIYKKPVVVWAQGVTMGGGIGLMNGASHRIVTDSTVLAMPEINIGFFPDVGSSYFLNQLPKGVGLFMGLTAARLNGADGLTVSLADFYIEDRDKDKTEKDLLNLKYSGNPGEDNRIIDEFLISKSKDSVVGTAPIMDRMFEIQDLVDQDTLKDLDSVLRDWTPYDDYFKACKKTYEEGCPLTVNVFYEMLKKNIQDPKKAYDLEWNIAMNFCLEEKNFSEGVRAVLIDKDNDPAWSPSRLSKVVGVEKFFENPFA